MRNGAASVAGIDATLYPVDTLSEAEWAELDAADAIVFGLADLPMGSASAKFKGFMDESSKRWFAGAWKNKVAAGFTTSASQSGDKLNTLLQLMVFANQHAMIWVGLDLMPGNNNSKGSVDSHSTVSAASAGLWRRRMPIRVPRAMRETTQDNCRRRPRCRDCAGAAARARLIVPMRPSGTAGIGV